MERKVLEVMLLILLLAGFTGFIMAAKPSRRARLCVLNGIVHPCSIHSDGMAGSEKLEPMEDIEFEFEDDGTIRWVEVKR